MQPIYWLNVPISKYGAKNNSFNLFWLKYEGAGKLNYKTAKL